MEQWRMQPSVIRCHLLSLQSSLVILAPFGSRLTGKEKGRSVPDLNSAFQEPKHVVSGGDRAAVRPDERGLWAVV